MFATERHGESPRFGPGPDSGGELSTFEYGWDDTPTGVRGVLPAGLDTMPPGAKLAASLDRIDSDSLNGYELVILIAAERRQMSHYEARSYQAMSELAHTPPGYAGSPAERQVEIDEFAADELRPALGWTRRAADVAMSLATDLTDRFPLVLSEMKEGRIDGPKARVLVNTLSHLEQRHAGLLVESIAASLSEMTTGQIGAKLRRLAISVDPESAEKRYAHGLTERYLALHANPDGTANLCAYNLPVLAANRAMNRINRLARSAKSAGDIRTIDAVRADVFLDLLSGKTPHRHASGANSSSTVRGSVDIRVDLTTLAKLNESPGEIPGWGPVVAEIARLAADPKKRWQATVTDSHGSVISVGNIWRRATAGQEQEITTEDTTCTFPGCRMPSSLCDIDHNVPWAHGGKTERSNLGPACRHDHNLKTKGGWRLRRSPDGSYIWTSRHGHIYRTGPDPP